MAAGADRAWLRWLHRIGYGATAIVLAEMVLIAAFSIEGWRQDARNRASQMAETRTHAGPLVVARPDIHPNELDLLASVPALPAAPAVGARFAVMPYLSDRWFAISVARRLGAARATGVLVGFDGDAVPKYRMRFSLPAADMDGFLARLRARTDDWQGDAIVCLDGTGMAFELRTAAGVTSGSGNAGCSRHYKKVGALVLGLVSTVLPAADRPRDGEWYPDRPR